MQHAGYVRVRCLALAAGAGLLLLASGHLSAQTPGSGRSEGFPGVAEPSQDETSPRLFSGPKGEIFRVWQSESDPRTGGGAVMLARAKPQDAWHTLLEI